MTVDLIRINLRLIKREKINLGLIKREKINLGLIKVLFNLGLNVFGRERERLICN